MICWHRAGRMLRSGVVVCRNCAVAIEYCPCVDGSYRKCDPNCKACQGSMWVAVVRGRVSKIAALLRETPPYGVTPGMWILYR